MPHTPHLREAFETWNRIQAMNSAQLHEEAAGCGLEQPDAASAGDLRRAILVARLGRGEELAGEGVLVTMPEGYGLLRSRTRSFAEGADDLYVSPRLLRGARLRPGQLVRGTLSAPRRDEKWIGLAHVASVCGTAPSRAAHAVRFDEAPAVLPSAPLGIGTCPVLTGLDAAFPLLRGQRLVFLLPHEARRLAWLQLLAHAVLGAGHGAELLCLLLDQPPEVPHEVRRALGAHGSTGWQVAATTFDEPPARHVEVAAVALQQAMRAAELGRDIVVLVDSLHALVRAANQHLPHGGKILLPGLDSSAFMPARRLLAAARQLEGAGSVTVLALESGPGASAIDQAISAEFLERAQCVVRLAPDGSPELGARIDAARCVFRP